MRNWVPHLVKGFTKHPHPLRRIQHKKQPLPCGLTVQQWLERLYHCQKKDPLIGGDRDHAENPPGIQIDLEGKDRTSRLKTK